MPAFEAVFSTATVACRTVDLINVLTTPRPPDEDASTVLVEVLRRHGETGPLEISADDVEELVAAAQDLRAVFLAPDARTAAERLNDLLAAASPPRLTSHDGRTTWHLHVDHDDDGPWGEWLLTSGALALATLLTEHQRPPGGVCAAPDCDRVFLVQGRGGPRRFCSPRCTTRTRVARHRRGATRLPREGV
ncbi:MAG TPA: CGNR zinc finger domain-containing protein [Actinopolymorphaceae bacterium]